MCKYHSWHIVAVLLNLLLRLFILATIFEEICEISISINNILLEEKDDFAQTYALSFIKLKKYYNIDKKFILKISESSRFRNKIVYNYSSLEEELVIDRIEEFIKLYDKYKKKIQIIFR